MNQAKTLELILRSLLELLTKGPHVRYTTENELIKEIIKELETAKAIETEECLKEKQS